MHVYMQVLADGRGYQYLGLRAGERESILLPLISKTLSFPDKGAKYS